MDADIDPKKIKLVVWDLDDTLWRGTLAEGEVRPVVSLIQLIRRMNDRGIVQSICSKNDAARAAAALASIGLQDEFVMPSIAWAPKGARLREMISKFQLRPENVLFVDDNISNREEARFYVPGIMAMTADAPSLVGLLEDALAANAPDDRKRLANYRMLAQRSEAQANTGDNRSFLRSSNIMVAIDRDWANSADRVEELVNRSNQLNYTKVRLDKDALLQFLAPAYESGIVRVRDRFGDYGIVGFFAVHRQTRTAEQLVFSCRVLDMGVEHHVWAGLGFPRVDVQGEVVAPLDSSKRIDWIRDTAAGAVGGHSLPSDRVARVLMIGGCDLEQLGHYLSHEAAVEISTYFNDGVVDGVPRHRDAIGYLRGSTRYAADDKAFICASVPFVDRSYFALPDLSTFDAIVYSPLIDYVHLQHTSVSRPHLTVSFGDFTRPQDGSMKLQEYGLNAEDIQRFQAEWCPSGPLSPEKFKAALDEVFGAFPGRLIILGGAENVVPQRFDRYVEHHKALNAVLKQHAADDPLITLIEATTFLRYEDDFTDAIRHYRRAAHRRAARAVARSLGGLQVRSAVGATMSRYASRLATHARRLFRPTPPRR
jgi:FkbH-like protein